MAQGKKKPTVIDVETLIAAGIDPKTGLPLKESSSATLKENVMKLLRLNDEQLFVNRFTWHSLPRGLDSQEIERLLYYRGEICIFWNKTLNKFFATPFAPKGPFDYWGRPMMAKPVPFGTGNAQDDKAKPTPLMEWFSTLNLKILWEKPLIEDLIENPSMLEECCVVVQDYTPQRSAKILSRQVINDGIIDLESYMLPYMRTALLNATGIKGMRVNNDDEAYSVIEASRSVNDAACRGEQFVPMTATQEFQEFTNGTSVRAEEFLLAMQAVDNIRVGSLGLDQGGIFEKAAHKLETEAEMATSNTALILTDSLIQRQKRADIMTALWGIPVSVTVSEPSQSVDLNGDGIIAGETDEESMEVEEYVNE
jgi:hypothetical protein